MLEILTLHPPAYGRWAIALVKVGEKPASMICMSSVFPDLRVLVLVLTGHSPASNNRKWG